MLLLLFVGKLRLVLLVERDVVNDGSPVASNPVLLTLREWGEWVVVVIGVGI